MVVALFAALIVPWFVNWNDYRASFEAEASRILGHRVHVEGNAHATILPSPSLTFTKVEVDDQDGNRIMDVGRFDVVIELMPLLQGEIRVVSMTLEKPVVNVAVDAAGKVAWLSRVKLREPFDPDKVVLDNITVKDGTLNYSDAQTGVSLAFGGISAQVTARALLGPWHVDGFYLDNGNQVGFRISTGRVLDDGTIRVKADVNPARWPVTVGVDGPVGIDPGGGLTWRGTYSLAQVATDGGDASAGDNGDAANGPTGWRSEGAFTLTGDRLDVSKAVLSNGPVDRPFSLAGSLTLNFGNNPSFAATAEAHQIDLDRTLGSGPSQPVDVSAATDSLVAWLSRLPVPTVPGSIRLKVPTIVVGGRIIEDLSFTAAPAKGGWQIGTLEAKLPGQATLEASGLMTTRQKFGFVGDAHLAVAQPATFATWWRGDSQEGAGRLLAPFDLSGRADIEPGRIELDNVTARIADATITGNFGWSEQPKDHHRDLYADLDATRIDFVQLKALGELLVGRNLTNAASLADGYSLHVKADAFVFQDLAVKGVEVNAKYREDALTVTALKIADIGGARIEETSGKIDHLSADPRGHLDATLDAPTLTGLARLADRFLPASGFTRWLDAAAPSLGEAVMTARITAPLPDGGSGFALTVDNGTAASTTIEKLSAAFTGGFAHWRAKPADIAVKLYSPDSAELARQFGMAAVTLAKDGSASLDMNAKGVPATGLDTVVMVNLAGLNATARGSLTIADDLAPSFKGTLDADADDLDPIVAMAGLDIANAGATPLWLDKASLSVSGGGVGLQWKNGKIGPAIAGGEVTLAPDGAGGWKIGGNLNADEVDLGWIASLGLGFAPLPTGDPAEPWSHEPFASPAYGTVSGKLVVSADKLDVGDLAVTGTTFTLALQPQRIDVDLTAGQLAGGSVTGGMSVHNVGGNANFSGRFDLKGAALESFVWRRAGRSVATGTVDLSANFESTGHSPAGLVSTMTGGGVIAVHDGLARYVNPGTARQIVRSSDLGQQFSEDALKAAFSERIDADNLAFKEASGAFAIVAGAVRLKNLIVNTAGLSAKGNAVVDFNTMTLDSDWNLAFDPVDNKVQGADPEAGIVFHGPIADPSRSIDVLQFAAYLNEREAARMTEIIALDAATRAEKERLSRLADKLKQDDAQRVEDARIAAEREARRHAAAQASAAVLEAFHVNREILVEQRHVAALAGFAARLAAAQKQAAAAASDAAAAAGAARAKTDAAAQRLADARQADADAAAKADAAAADLASAKAEADKAAQGASQTAAADDRAKQALEDAMAAETGAKAAADTAAQAKADAGKALAAATARAVAAESAANKAKALAVSTAAEKEAADKAAAAAADDGDAARANLAAAEDAVKKAQAAADAAVSQATALGGGESAAETAKSKADAEVKAAAGALAAATDARDAAAAKLVAARSDAASKQRAADNAASMEKMTKTAAALAKSLAGDGADADAIANADNLQKSAESAAQQAAAKKAAADAAANVMADAQTAFDQAAGALADAEKQSQDAAAAAARADAAVKTAAANANRAVSDEDATRADLAKAIKARDVAKAGLAEKQAATEKTASAAAAAARVADDAASAADRAQADLKTALAEKAAAGDALARRADAAGNAARAAQVATDKRMAAAADAKAASAKAAAAADASAQANQTLTAETAAHDAALADAKSAANDRQAAEAAAQQAETEAQAAVAAASAAQTRATAAAAQAAAAQQTADQAAQAATSSGPIDVPLPAQSRADAAVAPGEAAVASEPVAVKPVPVPRPKAQPPLPVLPSLIPTDRPLVITPPKY